MNARILYRRSTDRTRRTGRIVWLLLAGIVLATTGCVAGAPQPHVTAKVIYQHEDVSAELSSEWKR